MTASTELQNWLNGTPTGGPYSDGRYPLTYDGDGLTYLVYCPAAQALNPAYDEQPVEIFVSAAGISADQSAAAAVAADLSKIAAASSEANAAVSASDALSSKSAAAASATAAGTSETNAAGSATAAAGSAASADTSATSAAGSASAGAASATLAQSWASADIGVVVSGSLYSSRHYADAAAASAASVPAQLASKADYASTLTYKGTIPTAADLDTYVESGLYMQAANANAAAGTHYPGAGNFAGMLEVINYGTVYVWQKYRAYNSDVYFVRQRDGGVWSAWVQEWNEFSFDPASKLDKTGGTMTGIIDTTSLIYINNSLYGGLAYGGTASVNLYAVGGSILLRPNGRISQVGECSINAAGDLAVAGNLTAANISDVAGASTIVRRTIGGYINCSYLNTPANVTALTPTNVWIESGSDSYHRKQTLTQFAAHLITEGQIGKRALGPLRTASANTALAAGDYGGGIVATASISIACPNGLTSNEVVTVINRSGGTVTLTGTLLRLTGTTINGTRTIGPYGMASIFIYGSSGEFWISGPGVS